MEVFGLDLASFIPSPRDLEVFKGTLLGYDLKFKIAVLCKLQYTFLSLFAIIKTTGASVHNVEGLFIFN